MPALFCHNCQRQFAVPSSTDECPQCHGGFVEEVAPEVRVWRSGGARAPLLRLHSVQLMSTPGVPAQLGCLKRLPRFHSPALQPPAAGGGGQSYTRTFTLPGGGRGTVLISSSVGLPSMGGGAGGAPDPFMQGVLEAMMGGGFLHPGGAAPGFM